MAIAVLDRLALTRARRSRPQLFANLWAGGIEYLGQMKRAHHEASGTFSSYEQEPPRPFGAAQQRCSPAQAEPTDAAVLARQQWAAPSLPAASPCAALAAATTRERRPSIPVKSAGPGA